MNLLAPAFEPPADLPSSGTLRRTGLVGPRSESLAVSETLATQTDLAE